MYLYRDLRVPQRAGCGRRTRCSAGMASGIRKRTSSKTKRHTRIIPHSLNLDGPNRVLHARGQGFAHLPRTASASLPGLHRGVTLPRRLLFSYVIFCCCALLVFCLVYFCVHSCLFYLIILLFYVSFLLIYCMPHNIYVLFLPLPNFHIFCRLWLFSLPIAVQLSLAYFSHYSCIANVIYCNIYVHL